MAIRHWRYGTRRAQREPSGRPSRRCPRCDDRDLDEAAYSYLLGLYLGDSCLTRGRREVCALSIACGDDWPGLKTAAADAMSCHRRECFASSGPDAPK